MILSRHVKGANPSENKCTLNKSLMMCGLRAMEYPPIPFTVSSRPLIPFMDAQGEAMREHPISGLSEKVITAAGGISQKYQTDEGETLKLCRTEVAAAEGVAGCFTNSRQTDLNDAKSCKISLNGESE